MPFAALIDWCGPFHTIDEACAAVAAEGYGEALYIAIGSRRGQTKTRIQYVGDHHRSDEAIQRFNGKHPIQLLLRPKSLRLYVGVVTSQAVAGKKASHHAKNFSIPLYLAESALAFLMEIPLQQGQALQPAQGFDRGGQPVVSARFRDPPPAPGAHHLAQISSNTTATRERAI